MRTLPAWGPGPPSGSPRAGGARACRPQRRRRSPSSGARDRRDRSRPGGPGAGPVPVVAVEVRGDEAPLEHRIGLELVRPDHPDRGVGRRLRRVVHGARERGGPPGAVDDAAVQHLAGLPGHQAAVGRQPHGGVEGVDPRDPDVRQRDPVGQVAAALGDLRVPAEAPDLRSPGGPIEIRVEAGLVDEEHVSGRLSGLQLEDRAADLTVRAQPGGVGGVRPRGQQVEGTGGDPRPVEVLPAAAEVREDDVGGTGDQLRLDGEVPSARRRHAVDGPFERRRPRPPAQDLRLREPSHQDDRGQAQTGAGLLEEPPQREQDATVLLGAALVQVGADQATVGAFTADVLDQPVETREEGTPAVRVPDEPCLDEDERQPPVGTWLPQGHRPSRVLERDDLRCTVTGEVGTGHRPHELEQGVHGEPLGRSRGQHSPPADLPRAMASARVRLDDEARTCRAGRR